METQREVQKNMTVYNFDTIDVDGKPEVQFKCLKRLVGERGFEPPTPWSRTRFRRLLNSIETCRLLVAVVECVAASPTIFPELKLAQSRANPGEARHSLPIERDSD